MKKRSFVPLGEAEMELLQLVWELKRATVAEVHARVLQQREVAYTTVMTILKKLATKGYLQYEKDGTAYIYSPAKAPEQVRSTVLSDIIDKVFRGSPMALVNTLVNQDHLSDDDRAEIQAIMAKLAAQDPNASTDDA